MTKDVNIKLSPEELELVYFMVVLDQKLDDLVLYKPYSIVHKKLSSKIKIAKKEIQKNIKI